MAYFMPYVDAAGLHIPAYQDIEDYFVSNAQTIFGQDVYLANDSQDFQLIAANSKAVYDAFLAVELAYNTRGPSTAIGAGLDVVVGMNGLTRTAATFSTATVNITGTAFTVISNGVVSDVNGNAWALPASVTIGGGGTVTSTVTAVDPGPINATSGQISTIQTPTFGWASVTNPNAAVAGQDTESDSELRIRQALSVANPSQALTTGTLGSVLAVTGVTNAILVENYTNLTTNTINGYYNPSGFPPHSITLVVNGGVGATVAQAIYLRKTPGCYVDGDQVYNITDQYNVTTPIRFYLPVAKVIDVAITIHALTNYTSAILTMMETAITAYLNSLNIGQNVIISEIWQAALSVNTGQYPYFSLTALTAGIHGGSLTTSDISMNFNWQSSGGSITPTVT